MLMYLQRSENMKKNRLELRNAKRVVEKLPFHGHGVWDDSNADYSES